MALLTVGGTARAEDAAGVDWGPWQRLPVLDDGRVMPLDTFARRTVKGICGGQVPQAVPSGTAAELLLSWLVEPERWEEVPFLPASDPVLRSELLDVPLHDEAGRPLGRVSPRQVAAGLPKLHQRLEELDEFARRLAEARAAGQPVDAATREKEQAAEHLRSDAEHLLEAYHSYRMLTFHPPRPAPAAAASSRSSPT